MGRFDRKLRRFKAKAAARKPAGKFIQVRATIRSDVEAAAVDERPSPHALDASGFRWGINVIAAGPSSVPSPKTPGRMLYWPFDVLARDGVAAWDRSKSYRNHQTADEERSRPERDDGSLIGLVENVAADSSVGRFGALTGVWVVADEAERLKTINSDNAGILGDVGSFSITAGIDVGESIEVDGVVYDTVSRIYPQGATVDKVTEPAADGRFNLRVAAGLARTTEGTVTFETLRASKPKLAAHLLTLTADEATAYVAELGDEFDATFLTDLEAARIAHSEPTTTAPVEPVEPTVTTTDPPADSGLDELTKELNAKLATIDKLADTAATQVAETAVAASKLPEQAKTRVMAAVRQSPQSTDYAKLISDEEAYIASLSITPGVGFPGTTVHASGNIKPGADAMDKYNTRVDGFFARDNVELDGFGKVDRFRNVQEIAANHPVNGTTELYPTEIMASFRGTRYQGDERGSKVRASNGGWKVQAAVGTTSTWGEVFADRAYKRMMTQWRSNDDVTAIESWASDREFYDDFVAHRSIDLAEFTDPGVVLQSANYQEVAQPADVEETTTLEKHGFFFQISMESLLGPDAKMLASLPDRMIWAMMGKYREDLIDTITIDNPTMNQDSTTLYHANHSNQSTTALTVAGMNEVRQDMRSQTAAGSSRAGGSAFQPWGIIHPNELQGVADRVFNPSDFYIASVSNAGTDGTLDPQTWASSGIKERRIIADHHTNATDYFVQADPSKVATWELAKLRGVNAPQFFAQDSEDSDAMFDADVVKWKVRYFWQATPLNYRSFYWQNVA